MLLSPYKASSPQAFQLRCVYQIPVAASNQLRLLLHTAHLCLTSTVATPGACSCRRATNILIKQLLLTGSRTLKLIYITEAESIDLKAELIEELLILMTCLPAPAAPLVCHYARSHDIHPLVVLSDLYSSEQSPSPGSVRQHAPPEEQRRDCRGPESILPARSLLPVAPGCRKPQDAGLEKNISIWQPGAAPCTQAKEQVFGMKRKHGRRTPGCFCQSVGEGECPIFFIFF